VSDEIILEEIREFLRNAQLSNYEINAYITLITSKSLTAKEISKDSGVPTGRIYEVLDELKNREMILMEDSRPKKYSAINFNIGFQRLINHLKIEERKKISSLIQQAKLLESRIAKSDLYIKQEQSPVFWSTAFGSWSILSLYNRELENVDVEFLATGFLNEKTLKVIKYGRDLYDGILNAVERGVRVRYLWSFEYDDRILVDEDYERINYLYNAAIEQLENMYNLSIDLRGFEMKFIERRLPTYYDIFDTNRVIIKLQNPLKPNHIYACMNVIDPELAKALRDKYLSLWTFEASDSLSLEYPR
jgi:sugar-specific transcriptional regulator TrmB